MCTVYITCASQCFPWLPHAVNCVRFCFLVLSVTIFVCVWNMSCTAERIHAKFTGKMCLVSHLDEFECQGQRSRSPGRKTGFLSDISGTAEWICAKFTLKMCLVLARMNLKFKVNFGGLHVVCLEKYLCYSFLLRLFCCDSICNNYSGFLAAWIVFLLFNEQCRSTKKNLKHWLEQRNNPLFSSFVDPLTPEGLCCYLLFAWGVAEAKCVLVTAACVSVCPSPHFHTTAWTRIWSGGMVGDAL